MDDEGEEVEEVVDVLRELSREEELGCEERSKWRGDLELGVGGD